MSRFSLKTLIGPLTVRLDERLPVESITIFVKRGVAEERVLYLRQNPHAVFITGRI
jgi:hypothetical protein